MVSMRINFDKAIVDNFTGGLSKGATRGLGIVKAPSQPS